METQSNTIMADLLKKAQEAQVAVLLKNDGHSIHIDQHSHDNIWGEGHHLSFDVYLYEGNELINAWYFSATDDKEELDHSLEDMQFNLKRI